MAGTLKPEAVVDTGCWEREASHFPLPLSPLFAAIYPPIVERATARAMDAYGSLVGGWDIRVIDGYYYARPKPFAGPPPSRPVQWLWWLVPEVRRRVCACRRAVQCGLHLADLRAWVERDRDRVRALIAERGAVDLAAFDDGALLDEIARLDEDFASLTALHFRLHVAMALPLHRFVRACRELVGWSDERALAVLAGLSRKTLEPTLALAEIGRAVAKDRAARAVIEREGASPEETLRALAEQAPEVSRALDRWRDEYGWRVLDRQELMVETIAERPDLVLRALREFLDGDPDAAERRRAEERARLRAEAIAAVAPRERPRFERLLADAELAFPIREENTFYTVSRIQGLLRRAYLEAGARLAARGRLAARDDVFFLEPPEVRAALCAGAAEADDTAERARARRAAWEEQRGRTAPDRIGVPPPPPYLRPFPADVRLSIDALLWYVKVLLGQDAFDDPAALSLPPAPPAPPPRGEEPLARGQAASRGEYTGTARVIRTTDEFHRVKKGDVLVCPATSPAWSVVLGEIGALVTDRGGLLSHPAIVAREYGIPAVVGAVNATERIRDGERVRVDGTAGLVFRA